MRRPLVALVATLLALPLTLPFVGAADSATSGRAKWDTKLFASVPAPGYPASVLVARNGRVYAGTYVNSMGGSVPSRVFEWTAHGELLHSWAIPHQRLGADHGVQVANQTSTGALVLLETSTRSVLTLDPDTGRFHRVAQLPRGAVPNYASWGPGGLYVTDYARDVIWKVRPDGHVSRWLQSPVLAGEIEFGTTRIVYLAHQRAFLVAQATDSTGSTLPTNGHIYRIPVHADGTPGEPRSIWTSMPADIPDGFGVARSGHLFVPLAGLSNQIVELSATGRELHRYPTLPFLGDNGSRVPFDTPSAVAFLGTRILVANQSAIAGSSANQAILDVEVGVRGRPAYLPRAARFDGRRG